MRITQNMIFDTYRSDMMRLQESIYKLHKKISTGKEINSLSDDPVKLPRILASRTVLAGYEQYKKNIDYALSYLNIVETTLDDVKGVIIRIKEIAVTQATATTDPTARQTAAKEVSQLFDELVRLGNTRFENRHIFSGYKTDTAAFDASGTYQGDNSEFSLRVDADKTMKVGITGQSVFKTGVDVFSVVSNLVTALNSNDTDGIKTAIAGLDTAFNQVVSVNADLGGRVTRLQSIRDNVESFSTDVRILLSDMEDANIPEIITELKAKEVSLSALMASSAKVFQLSIFNYM